MSHFDLSSESTVPNTSVSNSTPKGQKNGTSAAPNMFYTHGEMHAKILLKLHESSTLSQLMSETQRQKSKNKRGSINGTPNTFYDPIYNVLKEINFDYYQMSYSQVHILQSLSMQPNNPASSSSPGYISSTSSADSKKKLRQLKEINSVVSTAQIIISYYICSNEDFTSQESIALRNNVLQYLFKCLLYSNHYIVVNANQALQYVIAKLTMKSQLKVDMIVPKDIMLQVMTPLITSIQDPRKITYSSLISLQYVIKLVPNSFYIQFAEKINDNIKFWSYPDKLMSFNVWQIGEETNIAREMLNTCHMLPWKVNSTVYTFVGRSTCNHFSIADSSSNTSGSSIGGTTSDSSASSGGIGELTQTNASSTPSISTTLNTNTANYMFFEEFVVMITRLEKRRYQFRNTNMLVSPYIAPLAKFMCKYPITAISLFCDTKWLNKSEVSTVFTVYVCICIYN